MKSHTRRGIASTLTSRELPTEVTKELPRLLRMVPSTDFPSKDVVATLDRSNNLVRVAQEWWLSQPRFVQSQIWRTDLEVIRLSDLIPLTVIPQGHNYY